MNQKGFATIFALCLLMAIAFVVMGIQAAEKNHAHESSMEFQAEFDLQNAADSALVEAADKILTDAAAGKETLTLNTYYYLASNTRDKFQRKIITTMKTYDNLGTIKVEAWGERINVNHYRKLYPSYTNKFDSTDSDCYFFFSRAEATNKYTGEKIYRRATAYVLKGRDTTIRFMELPSGKDS